MASTKIISARVPLTDYVELLERAKNANMSLADYLLFILFAEKKTLLKSDAMLKQLTTANEEHAANQTALRRELEKANDTIEALQRHIAQQSETLQTQIVVP